MRTLLVLLLLAGTVHAQRAPDMATLDRGDGISKFGIDLAYTSLDSPIYDGTIRFELYGQYVMRSGLGFYGAFPIARSFGADDDPPNSPDNATAIGNFDLGVLYTLTRSPSLSWVFRGGLALPTASDDPDGAATNGFSIYPRFTDTALHVPDALYLRFGFSPLIYVDNLFFRIDLGFDIDAKDEGAPNLLRFNVGGGIDLGVVALGLELVNLYELDDAEDDDDFITNLAFTVRFMGEQLQPFISIGTPIDDARDTVPFFFMGGIQIAP